MKKILVLILVFVAVFSGCSRKTDFVDNGQPGTIRVVVYNDENDNNFKDEGEVAGGELVGISHKGACPPPTRDNTTSMETADNGEAIFENLTPGRYCVVYLDDGRHGSKAVYEVYLSSEEILSIGFAIIRD